MYRAGIKPWNSTDWKPHLSEEAHERVVKAIEHLNDEKQNPPAGPN
jgi:SP family sugar:H+ symporter-like MFS transporter